MPFRAWAAGLIVGLLVAAAVPQAGFAASPAPSAGAGLAEPAGFSIRQRARHADFSGETASADARAVADWVAASGDNQNLPFIIVDKAEAKLFLFDSRGSVRAAAAVLLGSARGDDSAPGVGALTLSMIPLAERTTPAGRFVAAHGVNLAGQDIIWVDYGAAVALHRATDAKPGLTSRDRLARLASASTLDNRITHGCINVSTDFYDRFMRSAFGGSGIVYILPETRSIRDVFHIPAPNEHAELREPSASAG